MFSDQSTILSSEIGPDDSFGGSGSLPPKWTLKKIILVAALVVAVAVLLTGIFFAAKKYWPSSTSQNAGNSLDANSNMASSSRPNLPDLNVSETATSSSQTASTSDLAVEYLSFANFYEAPDNKITTKINDYKLPINVKMDVMNYYDVSRKLNLDSSLDNLNNLGFATIDNPWSKEAGDFYSVYDKLSSKQIPLLVTSDFILDYYQNLLKKAFKDVEENVFYDNLWDINKEMYNVAKNRYEARLASIGDVNDSILEGERLETAFFAVALELLKPTANQFVGKNIQDNDNLFAAADAERFYFVTPPYLRDDVLAEVKLIREGKAKTKSPVMLYGRNYQDFSVPTDYRSKAKLNNFYLTTTWLNSVFPLNYRDKNCTDCLLDKSDWRVNISAASFISQDFSNLPELKNKWARIYKVMSFFKGLREDLNYVHYRDSLQLLFGKDYKIEELFSDSNKQANNNLEKLRAKLLAYDFPEIAGGLAKTDSSQKSRLGFKMLAESYWPNNYIFSRLTSPAVTTYLGTSTKPNNLTACVDKKTKRTVRCSGSASDVIGLAYPISNNAYFNENSNYLNYTQSAAALRAELVKNNIWQTNNFWSTLSLLKGYLSMDINNLPLYSRSAEWQSRTVNVASAAWVNLQLPLEKFSVNQALSGQNFDSFSRWNENSYVEPNINLINGILANNNMLTRMFSALQLDTDVRLALQDIKRFSDSLSSLKAVVTKELNGQALEESDNEAIADFTKQMKIESSSVSDKQLRLISTPQKNGLKEDISRLKLLILIHQEGNNKVFSVGPVWNYQESR